MTGEPNPRRPGPLVPDRGARAVLVLDGQEVGTIVVGGWDSSYTFGTFTPGERFAAFAPLFGRWSLFMHEDEGGPLHASTSAALADAERQVDALHAEVCYVDDGRRCPVRQLNIDGDQVEWKEV